MPSQQNIDQLTTIKANIEKSQNVVIADYSGLSVKDQTELRAKLKDAGGELAVNKNRLVQLALKETFKEGLSPDLEAALQGPNATLYSYADPVSATKVLVEFAKEHESLKIKMGVMMGQEGNAAQILSKDQVIALAKLPGRQELLAMLVTRLNAPISGIVNVLAAPTRNLVYVLSAIKDKQS